jgi:hypothetical protein
MTRVLPPLSNWQHTRDALHQSLQVLRSTRFLGSDPLPNHLEFSSFPTPYGATTGPLKFGGQLDFDFTKAQFGYHKQERTIFTTPLEGHSQTTLYKTVFSEFNRVNLDLHPSYEKINHTTPFKINLNHAKTFAHIQYQIFTALSIFRSRLIGNQTPIVLWPSGFDLSSLWFKHRDGLDEHQHPHINFGFSPGLDKQKPYLYLFAWPAPKDLDSIKLPPTSRWVKDWPTPGVSLDYHHFTKQARPQQSIISTLLDFHHQLSTLLS